MTDDELECIEDHEVDAFDRGTRIRVMNDGTLQLKVPAMPPSWRCTNGAFDSFEDRLGKALGLAVEGWDKELFSIPAPLADTIARLRTVLVEFRRQHELAD